VRQVDDVAEPEALATGVVTQQGELGVQATGRVGDAALDRLRNRPTVPLHPVRQRLAGLVGPLQRGCHDLPGTRQAGRDHGLGRLQRGHRRR
jgi:hypothetical protein